MGMQGMIPPNIDYSKSVSDGYKKKTYKKGETCIKYNKLYQAKEDIDEPEEWNPEHWKETTVEQIRAQMKQEIEAVNANIADISPDDTAVRAKPWTSKHIVDMLCPPLEVSGNPVQCYPVPGYPLGITASWEPTQEGSGDPSPDNIRPIKGRDSVDVIQCGKNLLEPIWKSKTGNGIQWIVNADGSITIRGTATGREYIKLLNFKAPKSLPDGLYTLTLGTKLPEGSDALMGHYNNANKYIGNLMAIDSGESYASANLNGVGALDCYIECKAGCIIDIVVYPMLVQGDKLPDAYIPYNGDSATLALPEVIYGGAVDAVTGKGHSEYRLLTLTGKEPWAQFKDWFIGDRKSYRISNTQYGFSKVVNATLLCNYYPTAKYVSGDNVVSLDGDCVAKGATSLAFVLSDETLDNTTKWKTYLAEQYEAGHPVQVVCKIDSSEAFQAVGNSAIPALAGINTILTDADSVTVTARKDPIHLFDTLSS